MKRFQQWPLLALPAMVLLVSFSRCERPPFGDTPPATAASPTSPSQPLVSVPPRAAPPPSFSHQPPVLPAIPDLTSIPARQDYYDRLLGLDARQLWQQWYALLPATDSNRLRAWMLTGNALPYRLRFQAPAGVYRQMATALADEHSSAKIRQQLPLLLGRTATPAALQILLERALTSHDREQRLALLHAIEVSADTRWEDRFHPELWPPLENAWVQVQHGDDVALLTTLATAIAKTGSTDGAQTLLDAVAAGGATLQAFQRRKQPAALAAAQGLRAIRNPDTVPLLQSQLYTHSSQSPLYLGSGEALAHMGGPLATQVLLEWALQAPAEAAPLAARWFGLVHDSASVALLAERLREEPLFASEAVAVKAKAWTP